MCSPVSLSDGEKVALFSVRDNVGLGLIIRGFRYSQGGLMPNPDVDRYCQFGPTLGL